MRRSVVLAACLATILAASCGQNPAPNLATNSSVQALHVITRVDYSTFQQVVVQRGEVQYTLFRPSNWTEKGRSLLVYAHGYLTPKPGDASPPDLFAEFGSLGLKESVLALVGNGYGFAWSTASNRRGYAVEEGIEQTAGVRDVWNSVMHEPPLHTYVAGHSLGGIVTLALAEHDAGRFDGALAMCAPLDGSQYQTDYIANIRLVFDLLFNDNGASILGGTVLQPKVLSPAELEARITAAFMSNPAAIAALASATANGELLVQAQSPDPASVGVAVASALRYNVGGYHDSASALGDFSGTSDLLLRAGGSPFDPGRFTYTALGVPMTLPEGVSDELLSLYSKHAVRYLERFYSPTFRPKIPMITMHNRYDPDVPYAHELHYADGAQGSENFVQLPWQMFAESGHCNFTPEQHAEALLMLQNWVENGQAPRP